MAGADTVDAGGALRQRTEIPTISPKMPMMVRVLPEMRG